VPSITLASHGTIGVRVDLTRYYDALRRPGEYQLLWRPYGGMLQSAPLKLSVLAERQAVILTALGTITIRFYYDEAPNHVLNFLELAANREYDGLTFHRVIPGGLIQGGDPRGDGFGIRRDGKRLKAEFSQIPFEYGTVGMARSLTDPDSASSQFFICLSRQASFDGNQTAFGYVVQDASFETLKRIAAVPTGDKDRPLRPLHIRTITLEPVPPRVHEREGTLSNSGTTDPAGPVARNPDEPSEPVAQQRAVPLRSALRGPATTRPEPEPGG
jgi:peptidyl-prolyl cis-trans isomerase B (cyclophilin B)